MWERGVTVTTVQQWGNSQGLRISKQVLEDAQISVGDKVDVVVRDGVISITPVARVRGKHSLSELVSRIPRDYQPNELEWGAPAGREVW